MDDIEAPMIETFAIPWRATASASPAISRFAGGRMPGGGEGRAVAPRASGSRPMTPRGAPLVRVNQTEGL
jgi:hypothetical protein